MEGNVLKRYKQSALHLVTTWRGAGIAVAALSWTAFVEVKDRQELSAISAQLNEAIRKENLHLELMVDKEYPRSAMRNVLVPGEQWKLLSTRSGENWTDFLVQTNTIAAAGGHAQREMLLRIRSHGSASDLSPVDVARLLVTVSNQLPLVAQGAIR